MSAAPFRRRHVHFYADARTELERLNEPASQLTIFDGTAQRAPCLIEPPFVWVDTSAAAAQAIREAAPSIRERIWQYIATGGPNGATCGEICAALELNPSTCRPRLRELQGNASWCRGQLSARIVKTSAKRGGMRVYRTLA